MCGGGPLVPYHRVIKQNNRIIAQKVRRVIAASRSNQPGNTGAFAREANGDPPALTGDNQASRGINVPQVSASFLHRQTRTLRIDATAHGALKNHQIAHSVTDGRLALNKQQWAPRAGL